MKIILIVVAANIGNSWLWCFEKKWTSFNYRASGLWISKPGFGKRAFAAMPMAMEHQETGTLEELGIEFDRFLKVQLVQQKLMQILSCQRSWVNNRRFKIHCCSARWTKVTTCEPPAEYFECHIYPIFFLNIFLFVLTKYYVETFSLRSTNSQRSNWMYEYFNYI